MALNYHSKFYYVNPVTDNNFYLNFIEPDEGNVELVAEVDIGEYTISQLALKVEDALNAAGVLTYDVTFDRTTNRITISSTGDFSLLISTGINAGVDVFPLIGFTGSDTVASATATSNNSVATVFEPVFWLQDYIPSKHNKRAISGVKSVSANGSVEVVSFGRAYFVEMNIIWQNNFNEADGNAFKASPTAVEDLEYFMDFIINQYPLEFMENENDLGTFQNLILESTPDDNQGLGYKLKEMVSRNIAGYYETGRLVFRVLE